MGVDQLEQVSTGTTWWTRVPAHELGVKRLDDFEAVHRAVMALFPATLPGEPSSRRATSGILYRVDDTPAGKFVLVQSAVPVTHPTPGSVSKDMTGRITPTAGTVRFRLAVNAVRRSHRDRRPIDVPVALPELVNWVEGKLTPALTAVEIFNAVRAVNRAPGSRILQVDTVDGIATVGSADALQALVTLGVGRSKAYGCGLLTVALTR